MGDTLAVVKRSSLEEVDAIKVSAVELSPDDYSYTITYDGMLPGDIQNFVVANIAASPALDFVNCKVRSHRARSVLVKTRNVLIENCSFENTTGTAVHIGVEGSWMEGVASSDVIVRGNRFLNCGLGVADGGDGIIDGASAIAVHVNAEDCSVPGLHKRILIEKNEIVNGYHAIAIKGAEDVTICNNSFRNIRDEPILIGSSRRVSAFDNEVVAPVESVD